jgi:itaconyl-CoA hydratase
MSDTAVTMDSRELYFEDFVVGLKMKHARAATIGEVENSLISKMVMNTAQAHWNEHFVADIPLGPGRIVFGLVTASIVFGLASHDTAENVITELEYGRLRFRSAVHHGDTIHAFTEILSVEESVERADAGVVQFRHWGTDQNGTLVFEGDRRVLMRRREKRPTAG